MIRFLKSIDDDVWDIVEDEYSKATIVANGQIVLKPKTQWTKDEKHASNCNNKAMNGIYNGVTAKEFRRIFVCKTAKKAWDILQTVYKGTNTAKQSKLQRLNKEFDTIVMEEDETFDQFLCDAE